MARTWGDRARLRRHSSGPSCHVLVAGPYCHHSRELALGRGCPAPRTWGLQGQGSRLRQPLRGRRVSMEKVDTRFSGLNSSQWLCKCPGEAVPNGQKVCCLPVLDARSPTSRAQQVVLPPAALGQGPSCPSSFWGPQVLLGLRSLPSMLCTAGLLLCVCISSTFISDQDTCHRSHR